MATKFTREAILKCEKFSWVQKDFLAAILTKSEYTIAEAQKAVSAFFKN